MPLGLATQDWRRLRESKLITIPAAGRRPSFCPFRRETRLPSAKPDLRASVAVHYDSCVNLAANAIVCDGCGQTATPEHLTRRFKRLEDTTRFRPVHIQTVFLSDVSPAIEAEFLYSQTAEPFQGEALALLAALQMKPEGTSRGSLLVEFQRRGSLLAHVLECPAENCEARNVQALLDARLAAAITRLKRSLRPKRVVLFAAALAPYAERLRRAGLEAEIITDKAQAISGTAL